MKNVISNQIWNFYNNLEIKKIQITHLLKFFLHKSLFKRLPNSTKSKLKFNHKLKKKQIIRKTYEPLYRIQINVVIVTLRQIQFALLKIQIILHLKIHTRLY